MPTKPTDTITQIATDDNFSTSPVTDVNGEPTKVPLVSPAEGLVPGMAAGAANLNWLWHTAQKFLAWVKAGTSDADLDAHIVETDEDGMISAATIYVPPTSGLPYGVLAQNTVGGNENATAVFGTQSSTGAGLRGVATGAGAGVRGSATESGASGVNGRATGSAISVVAERTADNSAPALALSGNFAGAARGLLHVGQQTNTPSNAFIGDVHNSGVDLQLGYGGTWRVFGHRPVAWEDKISYVAGPTNISDSYVQLSTIDITSPRTGQIVIEASLIAVLDTGTADGIWLRVTDLTTATVISEVGLGWVVDSGHYSSKFVYTLPASGARQLELSAKMDTTIGATADLIDILTRVTGVY